MGIGRFAVFFLFMTVLLVGAGFYVGRRAKQAFGLGPHLEKMALGIMLGAMAAMALARVTGFRPIGQAAFVVLLAALLTTGLLMIVDLVELVLRPVMYWMNRRARAVDVPTAIPVETLAVAIAEKDESEAQRVSGNEPEIETKVASANAPLVSPRRVFLGQAATGSAMLIGSGSSFYGILFGRQDYVIEDVPVRIPGMSRRLDGYTIAQISDIHFGTYVGETELRVAEELIRKTRPDRIVLTGDLLDSNVIYAEMLGRLVRRLVPLARDGVVVIAGNHDWYAGVEETMGAAEAAGARILRNDGLVIGSEKEGIALLGVEDVWARRMDPSHAPNLDKAISRVPADLPRVLLCHNPVFFPEAAGKVALQLSGHTHGGQVNLGPLQPGKVVLPYGYIRGRYEREGSQLYVNRGFGTAGPPARIGAPPEVTRVVLVAG